MSFSIQFGNFLFKQAFWLYRPLYTAFKRRQDRFEIELLRSHIKKGDTVLDIGANIGFYAGILSRCTGPEGQVHCFEPDPVNFDYLQSVCRNFKNVQAINKAAGPKTEKIKIYTSKNLNVDHRTYEPEDYDQVLEIEAQNIDEYVNSKQLKVNFIKMDIQGFEMQAVKGMQEVLQSNPGIILLSEFWPYGLSKAGASASDYYDFLCKQNFKVYLLEKNKLKALNNNQVKDMEKLGEEHYFNILAKRGNV